jgi:hypothetical protein
MPTRGVASKCASENGILPTLPSFPRRRESSKIKHLLDPRLRGDDKNVSFWMHIS